MVAFLCILSIFLISVQGYEHEVSEEMLRLKQEHEGLAEELRGWLLEKVKTAKDQVEGQVRLLQETAGSATKKGLDAINARYEQSRTHLMAINAPKECLESADHQLLEAKEKHVQGYLNCANMTIAAKDVMQIVYEAGALTTNILLSADDILNGFGKCLSWNPFKFIYCTFGWIKTAIGDVFGTFHDLSTFTQKVGNLVSDIKAQIVYCGTGEVPDKITKETFKSLQYLHECAKTH